jgi:sulfonate transport system substrate-binding protein
MAAARANVLAATRRTILATVLAAHFIRPARAGTVLRMGFQKGEPILIAIKASRTLETLFAPLGWDVTWTEFQFGPPMLEAMRVGSIDVGAVGDTPPIFAQAGKADLLYIAAQRSGAQAVLLPSGSNKDSTNASISRIVSHLASAWSNTGVTCDRSQ